MRPQTDDACQNAVPRCDISAQYRNITGACNNIKNPFWGSANIGMRRYLAAEYEDGVGSPKQTDNLPLARIVSTRFHPDKDFPSQLVCQMYCNIFKLHRTSHYAHTLKLAVKFTDGQNPYIMKDFIQAI